MIGEKKYFTKAVLATQAVGILLSSINGLAEEFHLTLVDGTIDNVDLYDLESEIKDEDLIKVTFESKNKPLTKVLIENCLKNLTLKVLKTNFLTFADTDSYFKFNTFEEGLRPTFTLSLKCFDSFESLIVKLMEKYNKINNLQEFHNFLDYYDNSFVNNFLPSEGSEKSKVLLRDLFISGIVDSSYTRNSFVGEENLIAYIHSFSETLKDEKPKKMVSTLIEATKFFKRVLYNSQEQEGLNLFVEKDKGSTAKFDVSCSPIAVDLVKYILTSEKIKSNGDNDSYKFLLEKFIVYMLTSPNNVAGKSDDIVNENGDISWKKNKEQELFNLWLDLKNGKNTTMGIALNLVSFLKKYLKENEIKIIKDKFLNDVDNGFKEIIEKDDDKILIKEENGDCIIF